MIGLLHGDVDGTSSAPSTTRVAGSSSVMGLPFSERVSTGGRSNHRSFNCTTVVSVHLHCRRPQ